MRDIKDMSPETRARHLKHLEDTKKASKKKKPDDRNVLDLVTHMGDEPLKKSGRTIVTSENREEFMKKKLKLADKEEPVMKEKMRIEDTPHGIYNKNSGVIHSHYPNFAKARMTHENMGKRAEEHEIKQLADDERKERGYK